MIGARFNTVVCWGPLWVLGLTLPVRAALAQHSHFPERRAPGGEVGIGFVVGTDPAGPGLGLSGVFNFDRRGALGLRGDAQLMISDLKSRRIPGWQAEQLTGEDWLPHGSYHVTTISFVSPLLVGPQLSIDVGGVRPFVFAQAGVLLLWTSSDIHFCEDCHTGQNHGDSEFVWATGGGLSVRTAGSGSVQLTLHRIRTGSVTYLEEDDRRNPDGSVRFFVRQTEADVWVMQVGASFPIN